MLFFKILATLPFWMLYRISDFAYFLLFRVIKYRKKVVLENLRNSFPEKSEKEIHEIAKEFYHHLADIFIEFFKGLSISEEEMAKRVQINNLELVKKYLDSNTPIIFVGGHQGNWEWAIHPLCIKGIHLDVVYQKLSNTFFNKLTYRIRSRFGAFLVERKDTIKVAIERKDKIRAICLAADQIPSHLKSAYWTNFLNQDSAFFTGPERIARKFDYPVIFMEFIRKKRGYYDMNLSEIASPPYENLQANEILERFVQTLDASIKQNPSSYLWSHRRWKHKRSVSEEVKPSV
ncbi:lysophospholipid acyltransferase family protein [Arcicella sp. DC2W]|uniref:Lysophospholipid acyltransferase family protein n=1 Tax=Arcicella gelida TaxID=2984195 RepID=A0ABU5RZG3_9BACT|nr:lysophospholipid acyltransferase family protein [Arcicella sp. DC2W]MEA5401567.1 lysophospholipid acyltransferase family protein [Arcicella sp. DC2W]